MSTTIAPSVPRESLAGRLRFSESLPFAALVLQLLLALLVIQQFRLEGRAFHDLAVLTFGGFLVHAILPMRLRLPFFAGLSLAAVALVFGAREGGLMIAIGLGLIGVCHLPVRLAVRVAILVAAGIVLAACRAHVLPGAWLGPTAWGIFGSIFMFRLAGYLNAIATRSPDDPPPTVARTLAYFFMAPNVAFPLFPVVDYNTFAKSYYDRPATEIYQTGAAWIARGLLQLLMYRFIYQRMANDPTQLFHLGDLIQYLFATYLLYLRVSGSFHLIVGMLYLFGFRLPETHHLYYLASSFNDYWRRINIYWKDYMMKLVYYPSFFRLRGKAVGWDNTRAMVGATVAVFVATWLLHSYQWFWLRGGFPLTLPDTLFWGILGALVVFNALRESKRGRKRTVGQQPAWSARLAAKTLGTFVAILILWSLWSAESVTEWILMWGAAGTVRTQDVLLLVGVLGGFFLIAGRAWGTTKLAPTGPLPWWRHEGVRTTALLAGLLVLAQPAVPAQLGPRVADAMTALRTNTLNARDQSLRHKGYYEKLDVNARAGAEVAEALAKTPPDIVGLSATAAWRARNDYLLGDIKPSTSISFYRLPFTSNSYGMRDREYTLAKPAGTWRLAVLGPSHVMGVGVRQEDTFEHQLETRLNRELAGQPHAQYEVLNFGIPAFALTQQEAMLRDRALPFAPDVAVMTVYPEVYRTAVEHLANALWRGIEIEDDTLKAFVARAGLSDVGRDGFPIPGRLLRDPARGLGLSVRIPWMEGQVTLRRHSAAINAYIVRKFAREARAAGAVPMLLALDQVEEQPTDTASLAPLLREGERAGMIVVPLYDVYDGADRAGLRVATWDNHPNAAGHRLIADRLFAELQRHRDRVGLAPTAAPTTAPKAAPTAAP